MSFGVRRTCGRISEPPSQSGPIISLGFPVCPFNTTPSYPEFFSNLRLLPWRDLQPCRFPPGRHHLLLLASSPLPGAWGTGVRTPVLSLPKQQTAGSWHMLSSRLLPYQQRCQRLHQMYSHLEGHSPTSHLHLSRVMSDWQLVSLSFNFPSGAILFFSKMSLKVLWRCIPAKMAEHLCGTVSCSLNNELRLQGLPRSALSTAASRKHHGLKRNYPRVLSFVCFDFQRGPAEQWSIELPCCDLAKDAQLEKRLWQMYTSGKPPLC